MNVLLVDDSLNIRSRIKELIIEHPKIDKVFESSNLSTAKRFILTESINIAIIDIKLCDENGIDLLKDIKEFYPHITTLMLTNYPYREFKVKCFEYGTDYFLSKSNDFIEINQILDKIRF